MRFPTSPRAVVAGAVGVVVASVLAACGAGSALVGVQDPPSEVTTTAPVSAHNAEEIASRVLAKAAAAESAPPAEAKGLRAEAMSGAALAVANAADQLGGTQAPTTKPVTRAEAPKVLSISRGNQWPRVILAQSTAADGAAVLNVLVSPDARTPFRLETRATMQPGSSVPALDVLRDGSPRVTDGTKAAIAPDALMTQYAASLAYPKPAAAPAVQAADQFSTSVRANAAAQAKSFGKLATLTQKHAVLPDNTVAIALKGGGVLVFGLLERTDTIRLASGGKSLTPSAEFQRLVKKKTLSKSAELKSYETVVFTVPTNGPAVVVAADEVLFSAKGA
jgi:hypothetical protein